MLQWFLRFSEFAEFSEFNESSAPFRENPNRREIQLLLKINGTAKKFDQTDVTEWETKTNKQTYLFLEL